MIQMVSKYNIENLAHLNVSKATLIYNKKFYRMYDWYGSKTTQKFQKNIKKICYNLLKCFDKEDFPEGSYGFINQSNYVAGKFTHGDLEFCVSIYDDNEVGVYIYKEMETIWSKEGNLKDMIPMLAEQLQNLDKDEQCYSKSVLN